MSQKKLHQQAIENALQQDWKQAVESNQLILEEDPNNIPASNRLGFALMQRGKIKQAIQTYQRVVEIDKYNAIALKSLEKLSVIKPSKRRSNKPTKVMTSFIEEPGKTKTVNLLKPADLHTLASINVGTLVQLNIKKRRVSVESSEKEYLGCLPDDIGHKITGLISQDYLFETYVKSNHKKNISVFIKETFRPAGMKNQASFPGSSAATVKSTSRGKNLEEFPLDLSPTGEGKD